MTKVAKRSWAKGKALDGEGNINGWKNLRSKRKAPKLKPVTPKMYGTPPKKK